MVDFVDSFLKKCHLYLFREDVIKHWTQDIIILYLVLDIVSQWLWYMIPKANGKRVSHFIFFMVSYIWSSASFDSRDSSQVEKKILLFQAEQIHKFKTVIIQNGRLFSNRTILSENSCHFVNFLSSLDLFQAEKKNIYFVTFPFFMVTISCFLDNKRAYLIFW